MNGWARLRLHGPVCSVPDVLLVSYPHNISYGPQDTDLPHLHLDVMIGSCEPASGTDSRNVWTALDPCIHAGYAPRLQEALHALRRIQKSSKYSMQMYSHVGLLLCAFADMYHTVRDSGA